MKRYQYVLGVRWYYRKPEIAPVERPASVGEAAKTSPGWFHQEAHSYRLVILRWMLEQVNSGGRKLKGLSVVPHQVADHK